MSEQNFDDQFRPFNFTPVTTPDTSSPIVNPAPVADTVLVNEALPYVTPMEETSAIFNPVSGPYAAEIPLAETPVQVVPMGEAVPAASQVNDAVVEQAPLSPAIPYQAPVVESVPADEYLVKKPVAYEAPMADMMKYEPLPVKVNTGSMAGLLESEESEHFRTRWNEIQGKFVDDPRIAVQQADGLVAEVVEHITQMFATEHTSLETQWNQGGDVSTEDLRKALQHYRTFFNRLVI